MWSKNSWRGGAYGNIDRDDMRHGGKWLLRWKSVFNELNMSIVGVIGLKEKHKQSQQKIKNEENLNFIVFHYSFFYSNITQYFIYRYSHLIKTPTNKI